MIVRLTNNTVAEIFPAEFQTIEDIAHWYSPEFAAASVEAPEDVRHGMVYDPETKTFSDPPPGPEPDPDYITEAEAIALLFGGSVDA